MDLKILALLGFSVIYAVAQVLLGHGADVIM